MTGRKCYTPGAGPAHYTKIDLVCAAKFTLSGVCAQNRRHESRRGGVSSERSVEPAGIIYCCFAKYFSNKSCDRCAPSSVSSTDLLSWLDPKCILSDAVDRGHPNCDSSMSSIVAYPQR